MKRKHRNVRKAAILVASLEAPFADALLAQMSDEQAALVRAAIERLGEIDPEEQSGVIEEFFRIGPLVPDKQAVGLELDDCLAQQFAPAVEPEPLQKTQRTEQAAPFHCLRETAPAALAPFLQCEHPRTIAVVVSHLSPDHAAQVLAGLSAELQVEVARRLVDLEQTDPEILLEVERGLESWIRQQGLAPRRTVGMEALDGILRAVHPELKKRIVSGLSPARPTPSSKSTAPRTAPASFTFAELEQLDAASLTVVLHHASDDVLLLALAGAAPQFAERVLEMFPPAEAQQVSRALSDLGPTRLSDVEDAQQQLAVLASQLEQRGDIAPRSRRRLSVAV